MCWLVVQTLEWRWSANNKSKWPQTLSLSKKKKSLVKRDLFNDKPHTLLPHFRRQKGKCFYKIKFDRVKTDGDASRWYEFRFSVTLTACDMILNDGFQCLIWLWWLVVKIKMGKSFLKLFKKFITWQEVNHQFSSQITNYNHCMKREKIARNNWIKNEMPLVKRQLNIQILLTWQCAR